VVVDVVVAMAGVITVGHAHGLMHVLRDPRLPCVDSRAGSQAVLSLYDESRDGARLLMHKAAEIAERRHINLRALEQRAGQRQGRETLSTGPSRPRRPEP
jgi:hypothetical protein